MQDTAVEHPSAVRGHDPKSLLKSQCNYCPATLGVPRCKAASDEKKRLSDNVQDPAPLTGRVIAEQHRLSFVAVAPVQWVSPLSAGETSATKSALDHSQLPRHETSNYRAPLRRAASSLLSAPTANGEKHGLVTPCAAEVRQTVPATTATRWLSYILPAALGYTIEEGGHGSLGGTRADAVMAPTEGARVRPRGGPTSSTSDAATRQATVTSGRNSSAACETTRRGYAGIPGYVTSSHSVSSAKGAATTKGAHSKDCATSDCRFPPALAISTGRQVTASHGIAFQTHSAVQSFANSIGDTHTKCKDALPRSSPQQRLGSLSHQLPSTSPATSSRLSSADRAPCIFPTTSAPGKAILRRTATAPLLERTPCPQEPNRVLDTVLYEEKGQPQRSEREGAAAGSRQHQSPCASMEPCIADIRPPALQHGSVLFCSYCKKRLVRRKHYMQCWPEFLLCDACTLLPPCGVCHRKALPAYIVLQNKASSSNSNAPVKSSVTACESSTRSNCSLKRSQSWDSPSSLPCSVDSDREAEGSSGSSTSISTATSPTSATDTEDGPCSTPKTSASSDSGDIQTEALERSGGQRQGMQLRSESLHDADGLHLCGHCALLNPVNTKERLLRATHYALLWLRERHGVVFSDERLSVQKFSLVQQRVKESLQRCDHLLRSASAPEGLLLHTSDLRHQPLHHKEDATLGLRSSTKHRAHAGARRLRVDPTESVHAPMLQGHQTADSTRLGTEPSTRATREAAGTGCEGIASESRDMSLLSESLQRLCLRPPQVVHTPERLPPNNGLRQAVHQSEQNRPLRQPQRTNDGLEACKEPRNRYADMEGEQQCNQPHEEVLHPHRAPCPVDGLGFAVEAVGYSELNVGTSSSVFGRCETERLFHEDLLSALHPSTDTRTHRLGLERAVQITRRDAQIMSASSDASVPKRRVSYTDEHTMQNNQLFSTSEGQRRSLRCVRRVAVLRCLPETVFLSHLIHELMHAYIWCGQLPEEGRMLLQVEEGICNAVAASFLQERLRKLTALQAEIKGGGQIETAAQTAAPQALCLDTAPRKEPPTVPVDSPDLPAGAGAENSTEYEAVATDEARAAEARATAGANAEEHRSLEDESDLDRQRNRELLLLLIEYEARVIRTRLGEMETDEHYCYGKGYRVMRRIIQDLQLQQTLHVAVRHGDSLESVERAAASLRSRGANTKDAGVFAAHTENQAAASAGVSFAGVRDAIAQGKLPLGASGHCHAAGSWSHAAGVVTQGYGKLGIPLDAQPHARHPRETHSVQRSEISSNDVLPSLLQQQVKQSEECIRARQGEQSKNGPQASTRRAERGGVALNGPYSLRYGAQPRAMGSERAEATSVKPRARNVAAELLGAVTALFGQRTAAAEQIALQRATSCGVLSGRV